MNTVCTIVQNIHTSPLFHVDNVLWFLSYVASHLGKIMKLRLTILGSRIDSTTISSIYLMNLSRVWELPAMGGTWWPHSRVVASELISD